LYFLQPLLSGALATAETLGRIRYRLAGLPLLQAVSMKCQRMHTGLQLVGKYRVDCLMTLHLPLICEPGGDQRHFEVTFRTGRHTMHMAFVDHLHMKWRESRR